MNTDPEIDTILEIAEDFGCDSEGLRPHLEQWLKKLITDERLDDAKVHSKYYGKKIIEARKLGYKEGWNAYNELPIIERERLARINEVKTILKDIAELPQTEYSDVVLANLEDRIKELEK